MPNLYSSFINRERSSPIIRHLKLINVSLQEEEAKLLEEIPYRDKCNFVLLSIV
jgi:hypothetical protein